MLVVYAALSFAVPAFGEVEQGLNVDVYTYDPQSLPERQPYTLCKETVETAWTSVADINADWGGDVVAGCQGDFVLIHYYGYITMPKDGEVWFQSYADDGFYMEIGGQTVIDDWFLKSCWGSSGTHTFTQGVSEYIDIWWYEYGGGACNILYMYDETGISLVPQSVFTRDAVPVIEPTPEPTPTPTPTLEPTPEPTVDPTPVEPTAEPKPEPKPEPEPTVVQPETSPEPLPEPLPEPPVVAPEIPTAEEIAEAQMEAAQEDDIEVPEELAAIPLIGNAAVAIVDAINYVGNVGADLTPEERKKSQKVIVSAVIVGQVSQLATAAAAVTRRSK